jgi:hypothetical protein
MRKQQEELNMKRKPKFMGNRLKADKGKKRGPAEPIESTYTMD